MVERVKVSDLIKSHEVTGHEKYDADLLKWLVDKKYFELETELPLDYKREIPKELEQEFRNSQLYDILVFGSEIWVIEEAVSLQRAKEACSSDKTKGDNWFAGFAIHGQYKDKKKGHPLEV